MSSRPSQTQRAARRIAWIDWARALGACSIVLLHVLVSTVITADVGRPRLMAYTTLGVVLARWAVPGFFMLTGQLMLDPARTVAPSSVARHVRRMLIVLATFGYAFALTEEVWSVLQAGDAPGASLLLDAALDVLTLHSWDHLWYVYAMVGVYPLLLPLRALQARLGARGFGAFTGVLFAVVLVVPTLGSLLAEVGVLSGLSLPEAPLAVFARNVCIGATCCCVGACLRNTELRRWHVATGVASLAVMLGVSLVGVATRGDDQGYVFLQGSCFACIYAAVVLLSLKRAFGTTHLPRVVAALARDSFGIYVIHPLFIHLVLLWVRPTEVPAGAYEVAFFAVALAASIGSVRLLRKVPVLADVL